MTTQTEAELCAEALELDRDMVRRNKRSAAELRRQQTEIERLHEANQAMLDALKLARLVVNPAHAYGISIQSAIAKGEQQ